MGGMGNQMFQYAAAKALSIKLGVPLKLDLSFLTDRTFRENFTYRDFELNHFNIEIDVATALESKYYGLKSEFCKAFNRYILRKEAVVYFYEKTFAYNRRFESLPPNTYLEGYWQSEKYFKQIRSILLEDFTFVSTPDEVNSQILESIQSQESTSVHIRRGDFIANKVINEYHGICSIEYYNEAIRKIASSSSKPVFYFFSDDIEWVKTTFNDFAFECRFISNNTGANSFEDMRLMSACKNNIIANSSFSWWGAWLNQNPEKIVVAPKQWFSNKAIDTSDLIPEEWIKI